MADVGTFQQCRGLLFSIAYRMLGSVAEAEDMVQEAYLRWQSTDESTVRSPSAFLASVITRLCLDHLRSARVRREQYVGPWLPEPLIVEEEREMPAELNESLSMAFLVVLETLSPAQRAAFLLREVFEYPYPEVAAMLAKSESACRQLVHRAREDIAARRPRFPADRRQQAEVTDRFVAACATGDVDDLLTLLAADATLVSDGGGKVRAAQRPILGRDRISRFILGVLKSAPRDMAVESAQVNGVPGIILRSAGRAFAVVNLDIAGDQILTVHIVVNPDKLERV